jgi:hypothetical protein
LRAQLEKKERVKWEALRKERVKREAIRKSERKNRCLLLASVFVIAVGVIAAVVIPELADEGADETNIE